MGPAFRGGHGAYRSAVSQLIDAHSNTETVMSKKTTAALIAALGINFAMAGGALMLANLNKPAEYDSSVELATNYGDSGTVAGVKANAEQGDLIIPLSAAQMGGNMRVTFSGAKKTPAGREVHEGTWDQVGGAVLFRPDSQDLLAIEAVFDTRSLRTDAQGLTTTVTTKEKWFDVDNHPTATFQCNQINKTDAATSSHTHVLVGNFTLNGITKPIKIPAMLAFTGQTLTIEAEFVILRSDYNVEKRESSIAGAVGGVVSEVENEVVLAVSVNASPDPLAVISELAQLVEDQKEQLRVAKVEREQLFGLERRLSSLEEKAVNLGNVSGTPKVDDIDFESLPQQYTEGVPHVNRPVPMEMVLVPGSPDGKVKPVYMSQTEITWDQSRWWIEGYDLPQNELSKLINDGLHPSVVFGPPSMTIQYSEGMNPAMAMSMRTAKAYCRWLTEKTGRTYRLPTIDEWQWALEAGGGVPENIDDYAWHAKNTPKEFKDDPPTTSPAGSKKPNSLGIYDMLGSVAEWVTGTGEEEVVLGGTIFTDPKDITADWRAVASLEVWSESYPLTPKSRYWYTDFYATGIRVVCEPASVAANPPKEVE